GSGINLSSLKLKFDHYGEITENDIGGVDGKDVAGSSTRIADYIKGVSVYMGSTKVGSTDIANFTKSTTGVYEGAISLNGATIPTNAVQRLYVAVDVNTVVDSGDFNEFWSVMATSLRFNDGTGVVMTYTPTSTATNSGTLEKFFKAQSFETANSIDLKATISGSNPNEGIQLGKKSVTFEAPLLKFTLKAEGSALVVNKIPVLLTSDANVGTIATDAVLSWGSNTDSQSVTAAATTQTVTFGNTSDLGITIADGSSVTFTVTTTMVKLDGSTFIEGKKMKADLTIANIQATDSSNSDVTTLNGSANGYYQHFYTIAPVVTVGTTSITPVANGGSSTKADSYINVTITAQGGTIYLNTLSTTNPTTKSSLLAVKNGDGNTSLVGTAYTPSGDYTTATTNSGADEYYTIQDGKSITIRVDSTVNQATTTARAGMKITALQFGTVVTDENTRSANVMNWSDLTDKLKTAQITLN
ncbi:MAG: hypothetical protein NTV03_00435, partial [Candidatus Nomurabacteria bacterium]|nr:hypothetical protein [Candidatus Nomurabacteria bacterium]